MVQSAYGTSVTETCITARTFTRTARHAVLVAQMPTTTDGAIRHTLPRVLFLCMCDARRVPEAFLRPRMHAHLF